MPAGRIVEQAVRADRHEAHPTSWGEAVAEVLAAGRVTEQAVATALGYAHRSRISRLLSGWRGTSAEEVLRIDAAVATLAGHGGVRSYLDLEAAASNLTDEPLAEVVARCLYARSAFFKEGAVERLRAAISALSERKQRMFVRALCLALRGVVVAELSPSSKPVSFEAVLQALAPIGVPLEEVVSEQCADGLAWERVIRIVQHELSGQKPNGAARERLAATWRIIEALTEPEAPVPFDVSRDGSTAGLLYAIRTMKNGATVSTYHGDHKAAWLPFVPPTRNVITKIGNVDVATIWQRPGQSGPARPVRRRK